MYCIVRNYIESLLVYFGNLIQYTAIYKCNYSMNYIVNCILCIYVTIYYFNYYFQLKKKKKKEEKKKYKKGKKKNFSIPIHNTSNIKYIKTDISMYKIVIP